MPRYNVNHNDKWACFSSIVDGFITPFMDKSDYESWRKFQYGSLDYRPIEECNCITIQKATFLIRLNRTHEDALNCLLECGLPHDECEKLLYDIETECYCPIPKNGKFECPNCSSEVEHGQVSCKEETCELEFIWR
jgi:hypothetical protein